MKTVPLVTLPNEMEARLLAQRLDAEGIRSYVQPMGGGYAVFGVMPFMAHRVFVLEDDLQRAREILQDSNPERPESLPE